MQLSLVGLDRLISALGREFRSPAPYFWAFPHVQAPATSLGAGSNGNKITHSSVVATWTINNQKKICRLTDCMLQVFLWCVIYFSSDCVYFFFSFWQQEYWLNQFTEWSYLDYLVNKVYRVSGYIFVIFIEISHFILFVWFIAPSQRSGTSRGVLMYIPVNGHEWKAHHDICT
jgi:hypothetical protein